MTACGAKILTRNQKNCPATLMYLNMNLHYASHMWIAQAEKVAIKK